MHTTLINHAGRTVHIKTGGEGGTYSAQISPDGKAWPLIEKFSTTFARDMFAKGYIAHMTEQGYAPKGEIRPLQVDDLVDAEQLRRPPGGNAWRARRYCELRVPA
ncbi:hypothetical protein [Nocardiopsis alba]|uniref:Uncharacterized protein n=1 Tax=Nocardiopsis alba TaxID=53437 RepID=A0A7K2ILW3_9ACTN|nr:hypothetical protein [Nocardiopsis alba]MYR30765.1 hypothetical protein [Nocardiopsis alba]